MMSLTTGAQEELFSNFFYSTKLGGNFTDSSIKYLIPEAVNSFYLNDTLTDVSLITNTSTIKAHKLILAAISPYFRAKFSFAENQTTVSIPYDGEVIKSLLRYIYTGEISLTQSNIFLIMELQDFFQIASLKFLCCHYLNSTIDHENVWSIKREAECYRYFDLAETASSYICRHFKFLITKPNFLEVPYDLVMECLNSEYLAVPVEDELLYYLCRWLSYNCEERLIHMESLLAKIDVTAVTEWDNSEDRVLSLFKEIGKDRIQEWFQIASERRRKEIPAEMNRYKESITRVLLALGGLDSSGCPLGTVDCITTIGESWKPTLYLSKSKKTHKESYTLIPVMEFARESPSIASTDKEVYVLGGTEKGQEVEVYRLVHNTWETLPSFPTEMEVEPSMAVLDGSLYCTGGTLYRDKCLVVTDEAWVLHGQSKTWQKLSPMKFARHYHHLIVSAGNLYSIGGLSQGDIPILGIEMYEPILDIWVQISSLPLGMPHASCCIGFNHYIFTFCGDNVFSYDTMKNNWRKVNTHKWEQPRTDDIHSRIYCVQWVPQRNGLSRITELPDSAKWYVDLIFNKNVLQDKFTCEFCKFDADSELKLEEHKTTEHEFAPLKTCRKVNCDVCTMSFARYLPYSFHMQIKHPKVKPKRREENPTDRLIKTNLQCTVCRREFLKKPNFVKHLSKMHNLDFASLKRQINSSVRKAVDTFQRSQMQPPKSVKALPPKLGTVGVNPPEELTKTELVHVTIKRAVMSNRNLVHFKSLQKSKTCLPKNTAQAQIPNKEIKKSSPIPAKRLRLDDSIVSSKAKPKQRITSSVPAVKSIAVTNKPTLKTYTKKGLVSIETRRQVKIVTEQTKSNLSRKVQSGSGGTEIVPAGHWQETPIDQNVAGPSGIKRSHAKSSNESPVTTGGPPIKILAPTTVEVAESPDADNVGEPQNVDNAAVMPSKVGRPKKRVDQYVCRFCSGTFVFEMEFTTHLLGHRMLMSDGCLCGHAVPGVKPLQWCDTCLRVTYSFNLHKKNRCAKIMAKKQQNSI